MRSRGTHACTIAEIAKPSTSAHQTSQAIRKAFEKPFPELVKHGPHGLKTRRRTGRLAAGGWLAARCDMPYLAGKRSQRG